MSVTNLAVRILTQNLPVCDKLIEMCKDVFIARQFGDLMLEEELYWELIQIFRSPETLIEKTKLKQE
jgi:piezo-type mechanosensitive ion channel component 1/2